jgi:Sodium/hydrogen exchanger family
MENVWVLPSVWAGLALIATLVAIWFKISTALSEIVVGTVAQLIIGAFFVHGELGAKRPWVTFLAGTGAIVPTFLAGAELDPQIFRMKWKEATVIGLVGFFGPFLGCTAIAHFILHWTVRSSWLADHPPRRSRRYRSHHSRQAGALDDFKDDARFGLGAHATLCALPGYGRALAWDEVLVGP